MQEEIQAGAVFEVRYPFMRDTYEYFDEEGRHERHSWKPGARLFRGDSDWPARAEAHGVGLMALTVVGAFRPGRYPTRVFYERVFVPPTGEPFGRRGLLMAGIAKFRRIASGYRFAFEVVERPSK